MTQPNILMVTADQPAPHFTGAHGHPLVRKPTMVALAERGTRFAAAYRHVPLCAPLEVLDAGKPAGHRHRRLGQRG